MAIEPYVALLGWFGYTELGSGAGETNFVNWRTQKMALSDWRDLPHAPAGSMTTEWLSYRQALRDLPSNSDYPNNLGVAGFVPLDPDGN